MTKQQSNSHKKTQEPRDTNPRSFFSRTKLYLFEFTAFSLFSIFLGVVLCVATYSIFAVIAGTAISSSLAESLAWVFGFLLVLVPVCTILYARISGEELLNPARTKQPLRKVVYFLTLSLGLVSAIAFAIVAGYSSTRVVFGLESTKNLLSVSVPSLTIVLLHIYYLNFVLRQNLTPPKLRRINLLFITLLSLMCSTLILGIALVNNDDVSVDRQTTSDLLTVSAQISTQYKNNGALPDTASEIQNLPQRIKDKFTNQTYVYKPILSSGYDEPVATQEQSYAEDNSYSNSYSPDIAIGRLSGGYQLCAAFQTSTNQGLSELGQIYGYDYNYTIRYHAKGYQCFDLYAY